MNIKLFLVLVAILGALAWAFGDGIETIQEENTQQDVLGNTLNAAKGAAKTLSK